MYEFSYSIPKPLIKVKEELLVLFVSHLEKQTNKKLTPHKKKLCDNALGCFIHNTYVPYTNNRFRIGITLKEEHYSNKYIVNGRYSPMRVSYTYTKELLSFLYQWEYIELKVGGVTYHRELNENNGKSYLVENKTSSYVDILEPLKDLYRTVTGVPTKTKKVNVIILRCEAKKAKTFRTEGQELRQTKDFLNSYNSFSRVHEVKVGDMIYDVQIHKVYNMNFRRGARSFMSGSIQQLPKEERRFVTIDGDPCVCYDYVAFEPSIAYSMVQEVMEGDPYTLNLLGYDPVLIRNICKVFLNTMFNTKSKATAVKAMTNHILKKYDVKKLYEDGLIPYDHFPVKSIMESLENKHQVIYHLFYEDRGVELQYTGSLINDYILDYMMQAEKELTLQVHDCFIVRECVEEKLKQVMIKGYETVMGFSDNCNISQEF